MRNLSSTACPIATTHSDKQTDIDKPETLATRQELMEGLSREKKYIHPKYLYDQKGSELFEQITQLEEYYPSRTESAILASNKKEIADKLGRGHILIEPGAGSCEKVCLLLDQLKPSTYIPIDISAGFLHQSAERLTQQYSWLNVEPLAADFCQAITLPTISGDAKKNVFYPGSTIGNFEPDQAKAFLQRVRHILGDKGGILIGVDLQKDSDILHRAYNDGQGITAEFNRNIINHVNALLNTALDSESFHHHAFYNGEENRIEMHLECKKDLDFSFDGIEIQLQEGEFIHTENSYKYTVDGFAELAKRAGLKSDSVWMDEEELFSVLYLTAN